MRLQEYSANGSPVAAAMSNLRADPAAAACDWFSLEQLAHGSERVGGMVVRSAQVRKVLKTIARLSPYKATVLLHGESGTGKELVARALHTLGSAPGGPFVTFNCSNLVETLAESQLFGHVRGASTPSCCAQSKLTRSSRSARRAPIQSISDWSLPPIVTCARWSRRVSSATTCSTASTPPPSWFRRCANGARRSRPSSLTLSSTTTASSGKM